MSHDRLHDRPTVEVVPSPTAVVLAPCPFDSDPRHGYWRDSLAARGHRVLEIEILTMPRHWRHETELISTKDRISLFSSRPPGFAIQFLIWFINARLKLRPERT